MDCRERLRTYFRDNGIEFEEHQHPEAFTAQEVAASEHVPGKQVAKVVMVAADGDLVMTVVQAHHKVELDQVAELLGGKGVRLAEEDEFAPRFPDCDAGAMPPFGNLYDLDVYVDDSLAEQDRVIFQAGTHTDTMSIGYSDFEQLVQPTVARFGAPAG